MLAVTLKIPPDEIGHLCDCSLDGPLRAPLPPSASLGTDRSGLPACGSGRAVGRSVCRQRVSEPVPALQSVGTGKVDPCPGSRTGVISAQAELRTQDGWAERTREVVTEQFRQQTRAEPGSEHGGDSIDPCEDLSQNDLAMVNQEAHWIAEKVENGPSRAAVTRLLADKVVDRREITDAVFDTLEAVKQMPGVIIPISREADRNELFPEVPWV